MVSKKKVLVAVMTYNRGDHLLNCLTSIKQNFNFNYTLHVYDDHSNDKRTVTVLSFLETVGYAIIKPRTVGHNKKVKGLYLNMNLALDFAKENNFEYIFFIQDDMQAIRAIDYNFIERCEKIYDRYSNVVSIGFLFGKKNHVKPYQDLLKYDKEMQVFTPVDPAKKYMTGVADAGIFKVKLLTNNAWFFDDSEGKNIIKGNSLGLVRAKLLVPVLAFLPWPSTSRGSFSLWKRILIRLLDWHFNTGFHPFKDISQESIKEIESKPGEIAFAEDYLETKFNDKLQQPWNYYDSLFVLRQQVKRIKNILSR